MNELQIVRFVNFTDEDFVGKWGGVPQLISAGQSVPMEDWRARHYAKHLINRELQRVVNGQEKYPNGSKLTSPRKPEEIPLWNELLAKAIVTEGAKSVAPENAAMEVAMAQLPKEEVKEVESEFKCDQCGATAKSKAGLSAHQRSHQGK